jgi:hypothetical protein
MCFRFTIRDLLWLTLVVALIAGWWIDRWRQEQMHWWEIEQRNGATVIMDPQSGEKIYEFREDFHAKARIYGRSLHFGMSGSSF